MSVMIVMGPTPTTVNDQHSACNTRRRNGRNKAHEDLQEEHDMSDEHQATRTALPAQPAEEPQAAAEWTSITEQVQEAEAERMDKTPPNALALI